MTGRISKGETSDVIPPLSLVRVTKVTPSEPGWTGHLGRIFRIGYYRKNDGLNCVWLVDETGKYCETVDQAMIKTHFEVLKRSDEVDLYGQDRPIIGPLARIDGHEEPRP